MYNLPNWSSEFVRFLSVTPQFSFTGNIFDVYPVEIDGNITTLRLKDYLRTILIKEGYSIILGLDPFLGFSHLHGDPDTIHAVLGDVLSVEKTGPPPLERTLEILQKSVENRTVYSAVILNQIIGHDDLYNGSEEFFYKLFCTSQNAEPRLLAGSSFPRFNILVWIHEQDIEFPSWYTRDNLRIRQIVIPKPDMETRKALLLSLTKNVPQFEELDENKKNNALSELVQKTYNMQATEIISLISLVRREIMPVSDMKETFMQYSSGFSDNFWEKIDPDIIIRAEELLSDRIFGQKHAIRKVCNILRQSYLGLSGVQFSQYQNQPRGFVLFAGHEGVGKSTLANELKNILTGPDYEMIIVNMNDYPNESALQRMLRFSVLDNNNFLSKIQKNPYSIVLFENLESSHPDLIQFITSIIRDGKIYTVEGECISFSGCFIICTIRLQGCCPRGHPPGLSEDEMAKEYHAREQTAEEIIAQYFDDQKNLDFSKYIRGKTIILQNLYPDAAKHILKLMIKNVLDKIRSIYHIGITISPSVQEKIEEYCCKDVSRGGIGIGEHLESILVDPLSLALIREIFSSGEKVILTQISDTDSGWEVNLSRVK